MSFLPAQIIWNGVPFGFIKLWNTYLPVQEFYHRSAVKIEPDEETGLAKVTGHELQEASLTLRAMNADIVDKKLSSDPRLTFEALNALKGVSGPLFITASASAFPWTAASSWRSLSFSALPSVTWISC